MEANGEWIDQDDCVYVHFRLARTISSEARTSSYHNHQQIAAAQFKLNSLALVQVRACPIFRNIGDRSTKCQDGSGTRQQVPEAYLVLNALTLIQVRVCPTFRNAGGGDSARMEAEQAAQK